MQLHLDCHSFVRVVFGNRNTEEILGEDNMDTNDLDKVLKCYKKKEDDILKWKRENRNIGRNP